LYGVRSRLQVKRQEKLYRFRKPSSSISMTKKTLKNEGTQPISEYQISSKGLWGQKGTLVDVVRITRDHRLIAEVSDQTLVVDKGFRKEEQGENSLLPQEVRSLVEPQRAVVAYIVCL
ncbi:MAG: hypothetical protein D6797_05535, partial [Bdellovibrio sp.]